LQRPIIRSALEAQRSLPINYDVSADVWSATSYKNLRTEALKAQRWNMLPQPKRQQSSLETTLARKKASSAVPIS